MFFFSLLLGTFQKTGRPFLCAGLYAACLLTNSLIFDLAFGSSPASVALHFGWALGACSLYFWLLKQTEDTSLYWVVLILGVWPVIWF